jgi:hypothetical protein
VCPSCWCGVLPLGIRCWWFLHISKKLPHCFDRYFFFFFFKITAIRFYFIFCVEIYCTLLWKMKRMIFWRRAEDGMKLLKLSNIYMGKICFLTKSTGYIVLFF